jgi:predicted DNA-binding WGR domain protein
MQLYLESPDAALFWEITWKGHTLIERAGTIGTKGDELKHRFVSNSAAFAGWMAAANEKIEAGYQDPKGRINRDQLDVAVYKEFIKNHQLESAQAWLNYFGHLEDATLEDELIEQYIAQEDYTAAEKYVLGKLQKSTDANVVIRQVRYLATINPMLSRFMMGNLPQEVNAEHPEAYYRELGMAHSKIAFFDLLSPQLRAIKTAEYQLIYLTHLLDTPHDQHPQQRLALERAQEILHNWQAPADTRIPYYQPLIKGAQRIGQTTTAAELELALQKLEEEARNEEE